MFGMSKQSHHKRLAWDFLKTVSYEEKIQKQLFKYSQGGFGIKEYNEFEDGAKVYARRCPERSKLQFGFL